MLRLLDAVMALVFALFAAVQINDPAPGNLPWMATYAAGAVLCGLAAAGRAGGSSYRRAALVLAAGATAYAAYLLIGVLAGGGSVFDLQTQAMEGGGEAQREGWGLVILAAYTAWLGLRRPRATPAVSAR